MLQLLLLAIRQKCMKKSLKPLFNGRFLLTLQVETERSLHTR